MKISDIKRYIFNYQLNLTKLIESFFEPFPVYSDIENEKRKSKKKKWPDTTERRCSKEQKELFQGLKAGDVIFAKMPLSDKELERVPEGHRHRPYYVVKVLRNSLYAFACTSKDHRYIQKHSYYIPKSNYDSLKDSNILLNKAYQITPDLIDFFMFEVDDSDYVGIMKQALLKNPSYRSLIVDIDTLYRPGDVIEVKSKLYYVHSINKTSLHCLAVEKNISDEIIKDGISIVNGKNKYILKKQTNHSISMKTNIKICDHFCDSTIQYIEKARGKKKSQPQKAPHKKKVETLHLDKCWNKYPIGTLFVSNITNEEIVYLYTVGKKDYGMYSEEYFDYENYDNVAIKQLELETCHKDGIILKEDLKDVLNYHIKRKHGEYTFLKQCFLAID